MEPVAAHGVSWPARTKNALAGKRVMVTGHTGFKGGWLSSWLQTLGAQVAGLSLEPDANQRHLFDHVSQVVPFVESWFVDIRDHAAVTQCIGEFAPDVVFHLAAQPLVRTSYETPTETFDVNVSGTSNVLDAARSNRTAVVVCITTDKCYENTEQLWPYREDDPMGGWDPYSASKGAAELVIESYRRSFFTVEGHTVCASARAGNVIGGGDLSADRLVPDIYRAMVAGAPVVLRRPNATRPWQHVLESLSGYLALATALIESGEQFARGWNFGPFPSERITVYEFVAALTASLGDAGPVVEVRDEGGVHEAGLLSLDITRAAVELGWKPILTTGERIELTASWMKAHHLGRVTPSLVTDQIAWFEEQWATR